MVILIPAADPPMTDDVPSLEALGVLRRRLNDGHALLAALEVDEPEFKDLAQSLGRLLLDYLHGIEAIKAAYPMPSIKRQQATLKARLLKGWTKPDTVAVNEKFGQLLAEYEAVSDVTLGVNSVQLHMDSQLRLLRAARAKGRRG